MRYLTVAILLITASCVKPDCYYCTLSVTPGNTLTDTATGTVYTITPPKGSATTTEVCGIGMNDMERYEQINSNIDTTYNSRGQYRTTVHSAKCAGK